MPFKKRLKKEKNMSDDCGTCSWLDVAKNATLAVKNAIEHAVKNGSLALPEDEVKQRIDICNGCEFLKNTRCRACGCFIEVKAALASEYCPKKKWPRKFD